MSSTFGDSIKISIFGESHGAYIGVCIDGLPAGIKLDLDEINMFMQRRAPGKNTTSTPRKEKDIPEIVSGFFNGYTTGTPLCALIKNSNIHSSDYENIKQIPRPSHADYTAYLKYSGFNDVRGGGHFSGRLTAPMVFAGSVLRQILVKNGIYIASHIYSVADIYDTQFNPVYIPSELIKKLNTSQFALLDEEKENLIRNKIEKVGSEKDSLGGIVQCAVIGLSAGVGAPMFDGLENIISRVIFAIPAVKGIEFGLGFESTKLYGSENNDQLYYNDNGEVEFKSNNSGGINGGISNGMPVIFNVAFKPTPSIEKEQKSINLNNKTNEKLIIKGRHDPCIVIRALPVVESACAIAIAEALAKEGKLWS